MQSKPYGNNFVEYLPHIYTNYTDTAHGGDKMSDDDE